jgi:hypothetical protein
MANEKRDDHLPSQLYNHFVVVGLLSQEKKKTPCARWGSGAWRGKGV